MLVSYPIHSSKLAARQARIDEINRDLASISLSHQEAMARLSRTMNDIAVPAMQNFVDSFNRGFATFTQFRQAMTRGTRPPRPSRASYRKRARDRR